MCARPALLVVSLHRVQPDQCGSLKSRAYLLPSAALYPLVPRKNRILVQAAQRRHTV